MAGSGTKDNNMRLIYKLIPLVLIGLIIVGCSGSDSKSGAGDFNASNSLTTYKYDISNAGGSVEVKYTGLEAYSTKSFIVEHKIDGQGYQTYYPNVFKLNDMISVQTIVSIPANTSDNVIVNTIDLQYFDKDGLTVLSSAEIKQKTFKDEIVINVNVDITNEINNTVIVDLNDTNGTV